MTVEVFELQFDNQRTLFLPGQKVEGFVSLKLGAKTNITLLRVRFTGKVITHLQKGNAGISNENSTITMFKDFTNLIGDGNMNSLPMEIEGGDHVYPFEFRLPPTNLPASFEGPFGSVKYMITAVLVKSGYKKQIINSEIVVPSTRDVGASDLAESVSIKKDGYAGLLFWKSGYFSVTASIPKRGFASEEIAPITLDIVNHSNHGLILHSVYLKQKVTYVTIDRTRGPRTERIHRLNYSEEFPPSIREINRLIQFPIPASSVMNPDIDTSILKVQHFFDIKIQSGARFSSIIKIQLPVVVGGFPYLLFEDSMMRRSVDTLPRYVPSTQGSTVDDDWQPTNRGSIQFDDTNNSEYELATANIIPPDLEYSEHQADLDAIDATEDLGCDRSITPTQMTVLNAPLPNPACLEEKPTSSNDNETAEHISNLMHGMMVTLFLIMSFVLDELLAFRENYLRMGGSDSNILQEISNLELEIKTSYSKRKENSEVEELKNTHEKEMLLLENKREKSILQYEVDKLQSNTNVLENKIPDIMDLKRLKYSKDIGFVIEFIYIVLQDKMEDVKVSYSLFDDGKALFKVKSDFSREKKNEVYIFCKKRAFVSVDAKSKVKLVADFRKVKTDPSGDPKVGWISIPIFNSKEELNFGQWKVPLNYYPINFKDAPSHYVKPNGNTLLIFRIYPNYNLNTAKSIKISLDESMYPLFNANQEVGTKILLLPSQENNMVKPEVANILPITTKGASTLKKYQTKTDNKAGTLEKKPTVSKENKEITENKEEVALKKKDSGKQLPIGFHICEINNLKMAVNSSIYLKGKLIDGETVIPIFKTAICEPGVIANQYGWEFGFYAESLVEKTAKKGMIEIIAIINESEKVIATIRLNPPNWIDINDGNQSISFDGIELEERPNIILRIYKPKFGRPAAKKFVPKLVVPSIPEDAYYFSPVQKVDESETPNFATFTITIESARYLPDNCTATRITGKVYNLTSKSSLKNCKITTKLELDQSVYNPEFKFAINLPKQQVPPNSLLILDIQTIDIFTREVFRVGYCYLPLFVLEDETVKSSDYKYNFGAFQLPIYCDQLKKEFWGTFWKTKSKTNRARIPCATLLVHTSNTQSDSPSYSSKKFQTFEFDKPQESDLNLYFFVYSQKKSFSVRDRLLAMGELPKTATQTEENLLAWTNKLFEANNATPNLIDLSYIAKYDPTYGFKVSIDKAENLDKKGYPIVVVSFSSCPFKRDEQPKIKFPNDIWFRQRQFNPELWIIFELYVVNYDEIESIGWTAFPIFQTQKYVRMGRFALPLFENEIDLDPLMQYPTFEEAWGNDSDLSLTKTFSSITVRVADGRRDTELSKESSLKPRKTSNEEYVESVYAAFIEYTNLPYIP
ncbi:Coiled-coil domain-containing protein 17 [Boothiomyces sp. JEL0866]|nr:Coiled-coil domain-containing protein 17 [Boothiomyces sp. JEL0866]